MDKLDIVIPLGSGSKWEDNELRYCLRSIEQYMKNYRNIIIIGKCPDWLTNILHIPCKDSISPSYNIQKKLLLACKNEFVSEDFVYFNDDYFLTDIWKANFIPFYSTGKRLIDSIDPNFENWYDNYLLSTQKVLQKESLDYINFDIHYPIVINKLSFIKCYDKFRTYWEIGGNLLVKSLYCNFLNTSSKVKEDCKIRGKQSNENFVKKVNNSLGMFSTGDLCLDVNEYNIYPNRDYIEKLYPNKSKYEI